MKNQSVGKKIGILSRASHIFLKHKFKKFEIGHAQVLTLHFICRHDGISQNEIVKHFEMDKSSITSQLNILEKNGYINRKINKNDSRSRRIYITNKTKDIQPDLYKMFSSWTKILLMDFTQSEKELAFQILDKMIANAHHTIEKLKDNEENK